MLATLFAQAPTGLYVYDTRLCLVRVNAAARFFPAFPVRQMLGRPILQVLRTFRVVEAEALERSTRGVLETGRPLRDVRFRLHSPDNPAEDRVASAFCFRIEDDRGAARGVVIMLTDVTERVRAEARLRLLSRAVGIGTTLDVFRTAAELCDIAVPELADSATVDVLDSVLRGEAPAQDTPIEKLPLRRVGTRTAGEAGRKAPAVGEVVGPDPAGPVARGTLSVLQPELLLRTDPAHAQDPRLARTGAHSTMSVPMRARGVVLGLACFHRSGNPVPFDHDDLALAQQLASHTALCLDNARLYSRERSVARIIQRNLRPAGGPVHAAVDTAHTYLPAGAGGGWFDVLPLSGARVALTAGDTTAPLVDAAAAMGELRAAITALSELDLPPDEILTRLHDLASRPADSRPAADGDPRSRTWPATCLYAVYDPVTRCCSLAGAGHPPPALIHDGRLELVDVPQGPPLGQGIGQYPVTERILAEGSILVLHNAALLPAGTDSLPLDRLPRIAQAAPRVPLQDTCDAIAETLAPKRLQQDAVLLLARTHALDPRRTAAWTLPNDPRAVNRARQAAATQLEAWGLDKLADDTALVVSELVTNAVRYAGGPIELRLIRDRALTCEVTDDSSTAPHLRRALDTDEGGRGLFITAQLTERWGVRPARRGKTIWAELPTAPHPGA
ncbi:ATP-binding SpoIIE family protein phosphatase [Streptacidiphilus griseoplanus]|uniref:ATP-binding SpoIIE family protein phosphatase n=1 Tax=Peterkaempfera griseoplana TaxID=66896 RepID=UPI0006E18E34|nr:SpoIIE family protein phosphatase [Peterkaempfera griseoplana]